MSQVHGPSGRSPVLYTWHCARKEWRGTLRVKCLAREHNVPGQPLEPGLFDRESSALTTRPPRIRPIREVISLTLSCNAGALYWASKCTLIKQASFWIQPRQRLGERWKADLKSGSEGDWWDKMAGNVDRELIGSLRNHDDDGNGDVTEQTV